MRSYQTSLILLGILVLMVSCSSGDGKPRTLMVGGPDAEYATIAAAVDAAKDGDTISVAPGRYEEHFAITKDLQIIGQGETGKTVITWSNGSSVIAVNNGTVQISKLSICQKGKKGNGVEVNRGTVTVEDCELSCSSDEAAIAGMGRDVVVTARRNRIYESPKAGGIYASAGAKLLAEENDVSGCRQGLAGRLNPEMTFRKNTVYGCTQGVWVFQEARVLVEDNTIKDNADAGVLVRLNTAPKAGAQSGEASVTLRNNRIEGNPVGIHAEKACLSMVGNRVVNHKRAGVQARDGSIVWMDGDESLGNEDGVVLTSSEIHANDCTFGMNRDSGVYVREKGRAELAGCRLKVNLGRGIWCLENSSATVTSCEIVDSQLDAIAAEGASTVTAHGNRLTNSGGQGIRLIEGSTAEASDNTIAGSGSLECPGYVEKVPSRWSRDQRLWTLATTAVLEERYGHRCDRLAGCQHGDEQERIDCAFSKLRNYDAATHKDLMETIESLRTEGHQSEWEELREEFKGLSLDRRKALMADPKFAGEKRHRVLLQSVHGETLGDKGIKGFDLVRCIALVRWGYTAKILTEEEAWMLIMPLADEAQETFSSWQQLGTSYLVGREFWNPGDEEQKEARETLKALLAPGGTWTRYKWEMDLKPKQ